MTHEPPMFSEEKIRGMLKMLEEELPVLLEKMTNALYESEVGQKVGKAVGNFFREMKEAGMGDIPAAMFTAIDASNLSLKGMMEVWDPWVMGGMGHMGRPMMGKQWDHLSGTRCHPCTNLSDKGKILAPKPIHIFPLHF